MKLEFNDYWQNYEIFIVQSIPQYPCLIIFDQGRDDIQILEIKIYFIFTYDFHFEFAHEKIDFEFDPDILSCPSSHYNAFHHYTFGHFKIVSTLSYRILFASHIDIENIVGISSARHETVAWKSLKVRFVRGKFKKF